MGILETKRTESNASEYHLNHCHMEKYQPRPLPAALFQHIVLIESAQHSRPDLAHIMLKYKLET